jgi:hypothetical protein
MDLETAEAIVEESSRGSCEQRFRLRQQSADNAAHTLDVGDAQEIVAPFFSTLSTGECSVRTATPVRPVLEHIRDTVMDALAVLFSASKLSQPYAWGDVSARHLQVMETLIGVVLESLNTATLDASRLILKPESLMQFKKGEMLDCAGNDQMLEYLVRGTGSRMVGVKGYNTCSPLLTNSDLAGSHCVIGVANAGLLRTLGKGLSGKPIAKQAAKACNASPELQTHDQNCISESWDEPGESEDTHTVLRRILRNIVGPENVDRALNKSLDPFEEKNILVVETHGYHTKVIRLVRNPARGSGGDGVAWDVYTHDSMGHSKWDTFLQAGVNNLLLETGLKNKASKFKYKTGDSIKQGTNEGEMKNICGFLAFTNVIKELTGESLAQEHCARGVGVIRAFYVLWLIKIAESEGAIRKGYLAQSIEEVKLRILLDHAAVNASLVGARPR